MSKRFEQYQDASSNIAYDIKDDIYELIGKYAASSDVINAKTEIGRRGQIDTLVKMVIDKLAISLKP